MHYPRLPFGSPAVVLAAVSLLTVCGGATAQERSTEVHRFRVVTLASGLDHPWGIAFLPGGDMLVTERSGLLKLLRSAGGTPVVVPGTPEVFAAGQGGLLDVEIHPQFAQNRLVYLTYSKPHPRRGATTALARARLENGRLAGLADIFVADAWRVAGQHFGSRIVFDGAGHVFISIGERGQMEAAQDPSNHQGTIVRLTEDGGTPPDNPFVGRRGFRPEIWSYGHRSPQGMTRHPETGALWENEHGPRGGDEFNLIRRGGNYGWPAITFGINYNGRIISPDTARAGMEQPATYWVPSIAVSGLTFYTGDRFPHWRGNAFVGALAGQHLRRLVIDDSRVTHQEVVLEGVGRVRQVKAGPDGLLYLLTDEGNGAVLRLEPIDN